MLKVVIIEDEKPAGRKLQQILEDMPDVQVESWILSVARGVEWFENNAQPDLILSDIQLGDGLSFEIFKTCNITCPIIFTTAFNEYAIQAFDLNSIAYILKPFDAQKIESSIQKFKNFPSVNTDVIDYERILNTVGKRSFRERILVTKGQSLIPVEVSEIAYVYSEDKCILLKSKSGERYFVSLSLDEFEHEFDPNLFFRINRGMIVHRSSIQNIVNYFNGTLKLTIIPQFESEVTVSRRRTSLFKDWLDH